MGQLGTPLKHRQHAMNTVDPKA